MTESSFVLVASDDEEGSDLWVAENSADVTSDTQKVIKQTKSIFKLYLQSTPVLHETDEELSYVCLMWSNTDQRDSKGLFVSQEDNDRVELFVGL